MRGPWGVQFCGPLTPFADGLAGELGRLGYAQTTARGHLELWAQVSRWLTKQGLEPSDFTGPEIDRFLVVRRRTHVDLVSVGGLAPGLAFLRCKGAVPTSPEPVVTAVDVALGHFRAYLVGERSVLGLTAASYAERVRPFVQDRVRGGVLDLGSLTAGDVSRFAAARLPGLSQSSAKSTVTALRSLLRFLHVSGVLPWSLTAAVPAVASWRLAGLPQGLDPAQLQALLSVCDPSTAVGSRDLAMMLLLSRLALRSAEVAALTVDDLDWRSGTVMVHGKGNRHELLPVPVDVGAALAAYMQDGRVAPLTGRALFVTIRAPRRALDPQSVSGVVARAAVRAGLGTVHAHRLRHTAATGVLAGGASLEEVGQLLRHASTSSTAIYAKVDHSRLVALARPWPTAGGVA